MATNNQGEMVNQQQNGHCKNRQQVRSEALQLENKRKKIENEIKEYMEILQTQRVGMTDPLVDREGYPRNDIDIYQIRHARNKIICLQNDLKGVMRQIEDRIMEYFIPGPE